MLNSYGYMFELCISSLVCALIGYASHIIVPMVKVTLLVRYNLDTHNHVFVLKHDTKCLCMHVKFAHAWLTHSPFIWQLHSIWKQENSRTVRLCPSLIMKDYNCIYLLCSCQSMAIYYIYNQTFLGLYTPLSITQKH